MGTIYCESREQWLNERYKVLGASDSAAALGENRYRSRYALWAAKSGLIEDREMSEAAQWGISLEEPIAREVQKRTGRKVVVRKPYSLDVCEDAPFLGCTLDARQWDTDHDGVGVLQIKTTSAFNKEWQTDPPIEYQIQIQHEMRVVGAKWGSLVVLVGGQQLLGPFDYGFDSEFWSDVEPALRDFWGFVETKTPPPIDGHESTSDALKSRWPHDSGSSMNLGDEWVANLSELRALQQTIDELTEEKERIRNELKSLMQDASVAMLPDGRKITYKTVNRKESTRTIPASSYRVLRLPSEAGAKEGDA